MVNNEPVMSGQVEFRKQFGRVELSDRYKDKENKARVNENERFNDIDRVNDNERFNDIDHLVQENGHNPLQRNVEQ